MANTITMTNKNETGTWLHVEGKDLGFSAVCRLNDNGVERVTFYLTNGENGPDHCVEIGTWTLEDLKAMPNPLDKLRTK